jgi:hypothetical protein
MTTTSWRGVPKSGCATAHNEQTHYRLLQCGIRSGVCPLWVDAVEKVADDLRERFHLAF